MNYLTVHKPASDSFTEKKSEFIGYIAPVKTNDDAVGFINKIKAMHRKARHNVYAYVLQEDNISRYSDDGEPQGTAGIPVLEVIQKRGLTDVCIVVTRYFGGILLGGGGLLRAYSRAASIACDAAEIMDMRLCRKIQISTDYGMYGKISYILPDFDTITVNSDFSDTVTLEVLVMSDKLNALQKELTEITNGSAEIAVLDEQYADFSGIESN
ncbi:MAG: YigZ family protein [Ruminococcus sp.]|nr:YigZ family protein [Ruminococcus sp.]MDE6784972.1 YigZ family protein [Ruminococcus sp.]